MIFEFIGSALAAYASEKAFEKTLNGLQSIVCNDKAHAFAQEELRLRYHDLLLPASYEGVVSNLRLSRDDFLEYYKKRQDSISLHDHLRGVLIQRSAGWVYNRPDDSVFVELVDDFLRCYQKYFFSTDQFLLNLSTADVTKEILALLTEIRARMDSSRALTEKGSSSSATLPAEIKSFLTVLSLPFDVLEEGATWIDIAVIDPSSVFPNKFLLSVRTAVNTVDELENISQITKSNSGLSNILLVTLEPATYEIAQAAERRRISLQNLRDFRTAFLKLSPLERFFLGSIASQALAESLSVHDVYIQPDAFPVVPSDVMENRFFDIRQPAGELVDEFLRNRTANVLFVLGAYGSGKSAFCAHLMSTLPAKGITPIYFALRQVRNPDDLTKIVTKADQLARTLNGAGTRPLVILDGLDEMPNAMSGEEKKRNMLRLLEAASRTDKLIITARTSYFRGLEDFWNLFERPDDTAIWSEIARFIPESGRRPGVAAIIVREFNTDQIERYIEEFARARSIDPGFASLFLNQMSSHDFGFNYRMLARSPLYIFLLVNSRPWESKEVRCLGDVYSLFVKYWLQRDIEKGRSRWNFSANDRMEFMSLVAWKMFLNRRHALTFEEFDVCVEEFLGTNKASADYQSIALDLQTTGIFNSIGNQLQFFSPGFLDYFVSNRFLSGPPVPGDQTMRLPTFDQASMWAGLAETQQASWFVSDAENYLVRSGVSVTPALAKSLVLDARPIIYHLPPGKTEWWPFLNNVALTKSGRGPTAVRMIINATLERVEADKLADVRVRVVNSRGLHARAAAKVVFLYEKWAADFIGREEPIVSVRQEGSDSPVPVSSILGLMMLGAGFGSIIVYDYEKCSRGELESYLYMLGCRPSGVPGLWDCDFLDGVAVEPKLKSREMIVGTVKLGEH